MATVNIHTDTTHEAGLTPRIGGKRARRKAMTRKQLRVKLAEKGITLRQWAKDNGYQPATVIKTVGRYIETDRLPRGAKAQQILQGLSRTLGAEIVPGILGNGSPNHTEFE
jgi:gp16 family phage-associated protein